MRNEIHSRDLDDVQKLLEQFIASCHDLGVSRACITSVKVVILIVKIIDE